MTAMFWVSAMALTALALAFLFVPMLLARQRLDGPVTAPEAGTDARVSVYRAQLAELEADLETGVISEQQFSTARIDLQRSLLETSEPDASAPAAPRATSSWKIPAGAVALFAIPVAASLIYQEYGAGPAGLNPPPPAAAVASQSGMGADVEAAVAALSQRLEQNPEDPNGWSLLGRSLLFLEQPRAAAAAFAQAIRYGAGDDPDVLVTYADLLGMLDGGNLSLRARPFLDRALTIEPQHTNALWLAGLAAYQDGDYKATQGYWTQLATQFPPGSEEARMIRENLGEVEAQMAGAPAESEASQASPAD